MHRFLPFLWLAVAASSVCAQADLGRAAGALRARLVEQRRDFHMHPELSNREERTGRVIAERLRALKLDEVRAGVARHGVVAVLRGAKPGPVVAWRADMDALPIEDAIGAPYRSRNKGVKHACGHDVHMAVGLGIAELLAGMRGEIAGTVKFLFQPSEEGPPEGEEGGAPLMIKDGALDNPRPAAIFGLHATALTPAGSVGFASGPALASAEKFMITIQGRKTHAAWPHLGLDAITIGAECVQALQSIRSRRIDPMQPMVLTVGIFQAGNRNNIVAESAYLEGTLRTLSESVRENVRTMMRQTLDGCTAAHGAKAALSWGAFQYPVTSNEPEMAEWSAAVLRGALGGNRVLQVSAVMGGEDFSYYQKLIPGFFYWLGGGNPAKGITHGNHTAEFDMDEDSLVVGVQTGAALLLEHLKRRP